MKKLTINLIEDKLDFTREDYEEMKRKNEIVSFDMFIKNIIESVEENNETIKDAIFIANDAFDKSIK